MKNITRFSKARPLVSLVIMLSFCLCVASCSKPLEKSPSEKFSEKLAEAVVKKRGNSDTVLIEFSKLTDFEWDSLFVFTPYTQVKEINAALGYEWDDAASTGIDKFDQFNLLVFTLRGRVTRYVEHPRNLGEIHDYRGIKKEDAIFEVKDDEGGLYLVLVKAGKK